MLYLKEANLEDLEEEFSFIHVTPADEFGFMNDAFNCTKEEFKQVILPRYLKDAKGIDLPENYVPQTFFFLWKDQQIIGLYKIRHYLNETLANGGGHIGYGIKKEFRGKGYGSKGLALAIEKAKQIIKEDEIYMSVNKNNLASIQIQKNNGAIIHHEDEDHYYTRIKY